MAHDLCSNALAEDEADTEVLHSLGRLEMTRGRAHLAIDHFRKVAATNPNRAGLLIDLADALSTVLWFDEAISVYRRALEIFGEEPEVFEKLADAYLGQGDLCSAIDALGQGFACGVEDRVIAVMNITHQKPTIIKLKNRFDELLRLADAIGVCPLKRVRGWYVPRSDIATPISFDGAPLHHERPVCDLEHIKLCLEKLKTLRRALDIGANIGCWSWVLSDYFAHIEAFEPMPKLQLCFSHNVVKDNVKFNNFALGEAASFAAMNFMHMATGGSFITSTNSLDSEEQRGDGGQFAVKRLDDLNLDDVDFMKIDTEGFEAFIIRGALATIAKCKPVIYVEQIWGNRYREGGQHDAVRILLGLGAAATPLGDGGNFLIEWP